MDHSPPFAKGSTWCGSSQFRPTVPDGSTNPYGQSVALEGAKFNFPAIDQSVAIADGILRRLNGRWVQCIAVRNVSGSTLAVGGAVAWASGYEGRRVDALTNAADQLCAGIVDDQLTAAVADDDMFWLQVNGPTYVLRPTAGDANWTVAATLKASATTGYLMGCGSTDPGSKRVGLALSAATATCASGTKTLVDLKL